MSITTTQQTILSDGVTSIVITPIVQEAEEGQFVREVRVFGAIPEGANSAPLEFTLRMRAPTREPLEIATPSFQL